MQKSNDIELITVLMKYIIYRDFFIEGLEIEKVNTQKPKLIFFNHKRHPREMGEKEVQLATWLCNRRYRLQHRTRP